MPPSPIPESPNPVQLCQEFIQKKIAFILTLILTVVIPTMLQILDKYYNYYYNKGPYHTSILSGEGWVQELLNGHPKHIHTQLGVYKEVFLALRAELQAAVEQVCWSTKY